LADASSNPARSPRAIDTGQALLIVELRKRRMLQARIARSVDASASTVSRVLARTGMSKLSDLEPAEPILRYEPEAPGNLLHIDKKKLGRIVRPSHRVTDICFHHARIRVNEPKNDEATALIRESERSLGKGRFVIVRVGQIQPVLDFAIQVFSRIDEQIYKTFARGSQKPILLLGSAADTGTPNRKCASC